MSDTTYTYGPESFDESETKSPDTWVLVLVWDSDEPSRAGQIFALPPDASRQMFVIGRGPARDDDPAPRLHPAFQRPGRIEPAAPLSSRWISRTQLEVSALDGALAVRNLGRSPLVVRGRECAEARCEAGDVLQIGRTLSFIVARRPLWLPAVRGPELIHPFGHADCRGLVGESPSMWQLRQRIDFVSARAGHALVFGASGTGKELVARALHAQSSRAPRALVSRNAATFPEGLIDAELFGNAKNYPNPGTPERPGLIGQADGSTLFLDEIAELPIALQARLLRVLDAGEYNRLGEATVRRSDFRLIGATNRPESFLKHDLLARFQFRIDVPSLNERREDIPLIVRQHLKRLAANDRDVAREFFADQPAGEPKLPCSLLVALCEHHYTTNVRELLNLLWDTLAKHIDGSARLRAESVFSFCPSETLESEPRVPAAVSAPSMPREVGQALLSGERRAHGLSPEVIQECLDRNNGSIENAYRELGLSSRYALARLIRKHGLVIRKRKAR